MSIRLGAAVAIIDDLADFAKDFSRGARNALLSPVQISEAETPVGGSVDLAVYAAIHSEVARLSAVLPFAPDSTALDPILEFGRRTVAYWISWCGDGGVHAGPKQDATTLIEAEAAAALCRACTMLLAEQSNGYQEAVHRLRMPWLGPAGVEIRSYSALLFQRAIVLEAMLQAYRHGIPLPPSVLAGETSELLRSKRRDASGGWSYVPEILELPPDSDDLAVVLRVLLLAGGPELAAACNEPIDCALRLAGGDGGIPTWIVPTEGPLQEIMRMYISLTGSDGTHPDVVGNIVDALIAFGRPHHRPAVSRALAYLERSQAGDGSWPSRWYWGPYYGTYRAISALSGGSPVSGALMRAHAFLLANQNADGGWGCKETSDPLQTAFVVSSLARLLACVEGSSEASLAMSNGSRFLLDVQEDDGGWRASPFIAMLRSDGSGVHTYGSRTVSTAFCMQALIAASRSDLGSGD